MFQPETDSFAGQSKNFRRQTVSNFFDTARIFFSLRVSKTNVFGEFDETGPHRKGSDSKRSQEKNCLNTDLKAIFVPSLTKISVNEIHFVMDSLAYSR